MRAEIITIGDELCRGEIVNTNASWLASALWDLQITVTHLHSCRDDLADMAAVIRLAAGRSDLVLLSGGLGPTLDDLTVDLVCSLIEVAPIVHPPSERQMRERFAEVDRVLGSAATKQVRAPEGAAVYLNSAGLAPGFEVCIDAAQVIALPGPPHELQAIFDDHLRARISSLRLSGTKPVEHLARRIYRVFGKGEGGIATLLEGLPMGPGGSLHYQVRYPETLVKVVVRSESAEVAKEQLSRIDDDLRARLGDLVYGIDQESLPIVVVRELVAKAHTIATAESCTGGLITSILTGIPGVSRCFSGGAVTYSNCEKIRQLGVQERTILDHGAVSEAVAKEMALGVRERVGTDWGLSVSGIAGPGGGSVDKPVGTVCIALAGPDGSCVTKTYHGTGSRDQVRILAAHRALSLVRRELEKF